MIWALFFSNRFRLFVCLCEVTIYAALLWISLFRCIMLQFTHFYVEQKVTQTSCPWSKNYKFHVWSLCNIVYIYTHRYKPSLQPPWMATLSYFSPTWLYKGSNYSLFTICKLSFFKTLLFIIIIILSFSFISTLLKVWFLFKSLQISRT